MNLICENPALKISRKVMNVIYCDLWICKLKSFCVWMICDVVCHSVINSCSLYKWRHDHHEPVPVVVVSILVL